MRRTALITCILGLLVFSSVSFAGLGIHVGMDMTQIDETRRSFVFENDAGVPSTLIRESSSNPLNVGIDLTLTMIPIIDLQLSLEAAFASYDVTVFSDVPGSSGVNNESVPYLRIGGDLSALIEIASFPPMVGIFKPFIGGGLSLHAFGPVVSETLLMDEIKSASEEIKPEDYVSVNPKFGFHILFGIKVKPGPIPLGLRLTGKYYVFTDQELDTPENFLTIQAGLYFGG